LQIVLGYDALETGIKMLPVSITMFVASAVGARLAGRFSIRTVVRAGLWITLVAVLLLLATVQPDLADTAFAVAMAGLGVGMGLLASQLGKVVQASVDASGRSEAGGLQFTGQQLGSSLGVALIGAVVLSGLTSAFVTNIQESPEISQQVSSELSVALESGIDFVGSDQVATAAQDAGLDPATTAAVVADYEAAQLQALKVGFLGAALLALISIPFTRQLPHGDPQPAVQEDAASA
jgi:Na+/melibiose symporter-like transporter